MKTKIKLIIIDFDGPINDLLTAKKITITELCNRFKIPLSPKALGNFINFIDYYYVHNHINNYKDLVQQCLYRLNEDNQIKCNHITAGRFSETFTDCLYNHLQPNRIVLSALAKVKQIFPEVKFCIYTNQTGQYVEKFFQLNRLNIAQFTKIYGSDLFLEPKPSIKNLETICQDQNTTFSQTVMIGDDPTLDLLPANLLGIKTVLFNPVVNNYIANESDLIKSLVL